MTIDPIAFSQTQLALAMMSKDATPPNAAAHNAPKSYRWLSSLITFLISTWAGSTAGSVMMVLGAGPVWIMLTAGIVTLGMLMGIRVSE